MQSRTTLFVFALALSAAACAPDIETNTYFCGPEGLCPPGQSCNFGEFPDMTYSCQLPESVFAFRCAGVPTDQEPDDTIEEGTSLGELQCDSRQSLPSFGCITTATDVDHFVFSKSTSCGGDNPNIQIEIQFPIGAAPVSVQLVDSAGATLSTGEFCSSEEETDNGLESRCIDTPDLAEGTYALRITLDSEANASCSGECEFNRYKLVLAAKSR
ncbi:MAG: hypothetical protein JKY56_02850 [Kofleriaceae bacterium]|nr:hypothetical protein [Kofleriaceae bacterium]